MSRAINTATVLAKIRSKIDAQQQVISLLEGQLQNAILGGGTKTREELLGVNGDTLDNFQLDFEVNPNSSLFENATDDGVAGVSDGEVVKGSIADIYQGSTDTASALQFLVAIDAGLSEMNHVKDEDPVEQDSLRQLLYQARALLGELRIEEQAWNSEVNTEKQLRKEVNDFAKL